MNETMRTDPTQSRLPSFSRRLLGLFLCSAWIGLITASVDADPPENAGSTIRDLPNGRSIVTHFSKEEYGGDDDQIWATAQDSQGLLYALDGLFLRRYDGVEWNSFPLSFYARRIFIDERDRIFLGGMKEFGYADLKGDSLRFTSVRDMLPEGTDIYNVLGILPFENGAVFYANSGHYVFQDEHVEVLLQDDSNPYGLSFLWRERLYVVAEEGLLALAGDESGQERRWESVPTYGADLRGDAAVALLPVDETSALILTQAGGTYRLTEDGVEASPIPADPFLTQYQPGHGIRTRDGRFIVATHRAGVVVLDAQGEILEIVDRDNHPQMSPPIYHVLEDRQGNLWISTDFGIAQVPRSAARRIVAPSQVEGTLHRTYQHLGRLYFATRTHLYRESEELGKKQFFLEKVDAVDSGVWVLRAVGEDLLVGSSSGLFVLRDTGNDLQVEKICESTTISLTPSRLFPGRIYTSTSDGLRTVYREDGAWRCGDPLGSVPSYYNQVAEFPDGVLAVFAYSGEFYRMTFPEGIDGPVVEHQSRFLSVNSETLRIDGEIFYSQSEQGILRYQSDFSPESFPFAADSSVFEGSVSNWTPGLMPVRYDENRRLLWLNRDGNLAVARRRQETGRFDPPRILAPDQVRYWCDIHPDPEHALFWATNSSGVFLIDPTFEREGPRRTLLRRAYRTDDGTDLLQAASQSEGLVLAYEDNSLRFEFAAPIFDQVEASEYQWKLEGFDKDWSSWSLRTGREYTNLYENDYRFRVRARDRWGEISQEASFSFRVDPPFHRTSLAYGIYVLGFLAFLVAALTIHRKIVDRERSISRRLREVDQLKDEFLANTSHELRTPLFGITGLAESMLEGSVGELSKPAQENLAMIVSSGRRLSHLVGDILDMSKMRHQSLQLQHQAVDVSALVDVVLTLSSPLIGDKKLVFKNEVEQDLPAAHADENRLQQILYNLVGNAVKFTEEGEIAVSARLDEVGKIAVEVRDTGIGIPPERRESIFQAFEQADASIERAYGGTGLGLAVTRQLVELHDGEIWVESEVGEGSTFFFTLPPSSESPQPDSGPLLVQAPVSLFPADSRIPTTRPKKPNTTRPATVVKILVVDDEPVNQQVLKNYLYGTEFELVVASNGAQALRRIQETRFDLILLDVMMPKLSGFEVCRVLRETHSMSELPVLFLTAKNQPNDVETGLSLGGNDFLTKPIAKDELLARIRPHLDLLDVHRRLEDLVEEKISHINVLEGILPICMQCKKIRDEAGKWTQMEAYIARRSEAEFSHGICPTCIEAFGDLSE